MKSINVFKKRTQVFLLVILGSLVSCGFLSNDTNETTMKTDTSKNENSKKPIVQKATTQSYGYVVQPNYDHPKFKELSAAFDKEAHRFEIDACEFKYNDQSFFIGDSMAKIIEIFGEPDGGISETFSKKTFYYNYNFLKLSISFFTKEKKISSLTLNMSSYKGHENTPYSVIKFRKVPYQLDMTLNEFMELSDMSHDNVGHSLSDFHFNSEQSCKNVGEMELRTSIGSTPAYDSIGGGHMTIRGEFDPNVTGPIRMLGISLKQE